MQAIVIGVGLALVMGTIGALAGGRLLALMGASPSVLASRVRGTTSGEFDPLRSRG